MGNLENRKTKRFDVTVSAEVYTKQDVLSSTTHNLSNTGVCLKLDEELKEGVDIGVSLFLTNDGIEDPDTQPVNLKAKVMWCADREDTGYSAGAKFEDVQPKQEETLKEFLSVFE